MKVFKIILGLLIVIFFGIVYWLNKEYFNQPQQLDILKFNVDLHTGEWPNAIFYVIIFVFGVVVTFFFDWLSRLPVNKKVKMLNKTIKEQNNRIAELDSELELLQAGISGGDHEMLTDGDGEGEVEGEILYHKEGKAGDE